MFKTGGFSDLPEFQGFSEYYLIFGKSYKIIRNSDEKVLYMKVAQNDETNRNTLSVHLSHAPSVANIELFPSGSSVRKCLTPGKLFGCYPPSPVSHSTALEHP